MNLCKLSYWLTAKLFPVGLYSEQDVSHIFTCISARPPHARGPRRMPCSPPPKAGTAGDLQGPASQGPRRPLHEWPPVKSALAAVEYSTSGAAVVIRWRWRNAMPDIQLWQVNSVLPAVCRVCRTPVCHSAVHCCSPT